MTIVDPPPATPALKGSTLRALAAAAESGRLAPPRASTLPPCRAMIAGTRPVYCL